MNNKPIYKTFLACGSRTSAILMYLSLALMTWGGCGGSDNPTTIEDGEPIAVTPTGGLSGQVEAIDEVQFNVRVLQDGKVIATTVADASGNYQIDAIKPGTYTVEITAKGFEAMEKTVQVVTNQVVPVGEVMLKALEIPVAHIRGRLQDEATRRALADVLVQLIEVHGETLEVLTTNTGVFTFENLPAEQQFTLKVSLDGYEEQEVGIAPIPEGETEIITIELVPILEPGELPPGEGLSVGTEAPNFSLLDGDGKRHALADYAGQKVVLLFDRGRW